MSAPFPRILSTGEAGFEGEFQQLIDGRAQGSRPEQAEAVAAIIEAVRLRGDSALLEYTRQYDRHEADSVASLLWQAADFQAAFEALDEPLRNALQAAADRIRDYAQRQKLESFEFEDAQGSRLGQRVNALQRVGVYVPGGTAAYPSSVLMNAIPARVAGVEEILMVSPAPDGEVNPVVLAAAHVAGIDRGGRSAAPRPSPRSRSARKPSRLWTRSSAPATCGWPRPSGRYSAGSASTWWPGRRKWWW